MSLHRSIARRSIAALILFNVSCSWFTDEPDQTETKWDEILPPPDEATATEPPAEPGVPKAIEPIVTSPEPSTVAAPESAHPKSVHTAEEVPSAPAITSAETPPPAAPSTVATETASPKGENPVEAAPVNAGKQAEPIKVAHTEAKPTPKAELKAVPAPIAPVPAAVAPSAAAQTAPAIEIPPAPKRPFSRPLDRDVDPVVIKGENLKPLLGKPIASIRLSAVRANGMEPIPFQIDERDDDNDYVFTFGPDKDVDDDKGLLDANDELVFMARDLGDQLTGDYPVNKGGKPAATKELVMKDPIDGKRGYAYLTAWTGDAPFQSTKDYVTYKAAEDLVECTSFAVGFNKDTPFAIDRSMIRKPNGQFSDNRVDILKVRLRSTIFRFYDFDRDQDDFGSKTAAWIDGPVRAILHKGISVRMILGIQSPKIWNDTVFYPYGLSYGIDVKTPFKIPSIFSKFAMYSGMDFRDLKGGTFYTNGMSRPVTITGNASNPEIAALNANPDENRFAAIGWEGSYFIMRIKIPSDIPLKVNAYLIDDPNYLDPPERFPGAVPGMYFKIDDWLKVQQTNINIVTSVFVTDTFVPGQEKVFISKSDRPVALENPEK